MCAFGRLIACFCILVTVRLMKRTHQLWLPWFHVFQEKVHVLQTILVKMEELVTAVEESQENTIAPVKRVGMVTRVQHVSLSLLNPQTT